MLGIFIDQNEAYKLTEKLQPQGPLGVTLDYSLALAWPTAAPGTASNIRRTWMFSTHLSFREPVSTITDAQLWQIARDAAREMETDMGQYEIGFNPRNRPTAMTVLAFDHELILASSLKGDSFTYEFGESPVLEALQRCQAAWRDDEPARDDRPHRTHGRCGEIMAAHLYYMSHGKTSRLSERNARVGTVLAANQKKGANLKATDPCGELVSYQVYFLCFDTVLTLQRTHGAATCL